MLANNRDQLRAVPFGGSGLAVDLLPAAVNQQCREQTDGVELARCPAGLIDK
jgi:hypothetical protein